MRTLVFTPQHSGHRLQFAAELTNGLVDMGSDVVFAISENCLGSPEAEAFVDPLPNEVEILPCLTDPPPTFSGFRKSISQLFDLTESSQCNHVFIPTADGLAQTAGTLPKAWTKKRSIVSELIMLRGSLAYAENWKQKLSGTLSQRLLNLAPWNIYHLLDPLVFECVSKSNPRLARRCRVVPEPVEPFQTFDYHQACELLGLPNDRKFIGCAGRLDSRKGIQYLLRAFAKANCKAETTLLLAGKTTDEISKQIQSEHQHLIDEKKIIVMDRFISQQELEAVLSLLELICVPYPRHVGSSGILVRAAQMKKRVLASDWGWVGWATRTFRLGSTCNVTRLDEFRAAIENEDRQPSSDWPPQAELFSQFHSVSNYQAHLTSHIRELGGLDQDDRLVPWQRVKEEL